MRTLMPLSLLALFACAAPDEGDTVPDGSEFPADAVDERVDFPEPEWQEAVVFDSHDYVIPPYSEKQLCLYLTWEGDTVGINRQVTYQSKFGHHFVLAGTTTTERVVADGEVLDCTDSSGPGMENFEPILIGGTIADANQRGEFQLPEGMAARLRKGQRLILQSHYLNTGDTPIIVKDQLQLQVVPEDEVEIWAAPFVHTETDLAIPAGTKSQIEVTCTWEGTFNLLYLGGHLHEWGDFFQVDMTRAGAEASERIYEVAEWDPYFRDAPVYTDYTAEPLVVQAGDSFTTTCAWDNDTADTLGFPSEMCVTFGMVYPQQVPIICEVD